MPQAARVWAEGRHFVSGNSLFFIWGRGEAAMDGGRAAPRWAWQWAQKDGCVQRTGAHARPKPTIYHIFI